MDNTSETMSDFAIAQFQRSILERGNYDEQEDIDLLEDLNFPHWKDIMDKVQNLWCKRYEGHMSSFQDNSHLINEHFTKLKVDITKIYAKKKDYAHIRKYFDFVIDYQIESIRKSSMAKSFDNDTKENDHPILNEVSVKIPKLKILDNPFIKLDNKNIAINNNSKILSNSASQSLNKLSKKEVIKKLAQFEVSHLIRAHSKNNDVSDNATVINDADFELKRPLAELDQVPEYTNLAATCAENIINFIDVESGKIVKRFNDDFLLNGVKDVYQKVAWTNINGESVLVGGGSHGQIKIILPKYSACFNRVDAHSKGPICALNFHYKYSHILLSASDDNIIKIWKLDLNESTSDLDCQCPCELIGKIHLNAADMNKKDPVLSMCFVSNNFLIISTNTNNYQVQLNEDRLINFNKRKLSKLEKINEDENQEDIDDAIKYMTSDPNADKENIFNAEPIYIEGKSDNNVPYKDEFITNKFIYFNNILYANIVGSNVVMLLEIKQEGDHQIKLKEINTIKVSDEPALVDTYLSLYRSKDTETVYLIKSSQLSCFYLITLDPKTNYTTFILTYRCKLPTDYSIKRLCDNSNLNIKSYGLLPTPKIIKCVCNDNYALITTDYNIISIWKKSTLSNSNSANTTSVDQ